jgi:polar amino acid transport system substrate-binding protein
MSAEGETRSKERSKRVSITPAVWPTRASGLLALVLISWSLTGELALGGTSDGAASPVTVMTVCAVPASMPRTGKAPDGAPEGVDVAVAQRIGFLLGRRIEFHWCANAQCSWHCLPAGRCDIVIGQPQDSGPARDVAWSVPYASAQFGLVVARDARGLHSLADCRRKRVGIVAGTVAISENDHIVTYFRSREELLDGFATRLLDAGFLDADFAAWYLHQHSQLSLRLVPEYVPRERWNMAIAVRAKDASLLVEINRALAQLTESGELRKIWAGFGLSFHPPFAAARQQQASPNTWRRIRERGEVVVSIDPASLPYSSAKDDRAGIDVELARALAERLHVKLRIEWLDIQHETAVGRLLEHKCDLILGEAIATNAVADDEELAGKLLYSRPYYGTGYLLVERKNGPHVRSLRELKGARSQRLGAEAGSLADYSLRQRGYARRLYRNQLAVLKALDDGDIDHAYLWANAGWTLQTSPGFKLELVANYVPEEHWNIAVAMRSGDDELKQQVDAVLDALAADGTVRHIMGRYHVPYFTPFPEAPHDTQGSAVKPIRHELADRGPEPQMQKVQTSKHSYAGLARVRSAGEIVVGLDQNNLPFSAAHPEPAGFEFDVARLLAQQLGLRLRVYWAISAHDSYPSKLSSKGLCDVILGVAPDDRFEHRVLYSRPYYRARYELVVRSGAGAPAPDEPLAVEEGVAVSGLKGGPVQSFPSTEAILKAVAHGQLKGGYVISTRGHWLAHENWPGKLDFLPTAASVDCFPISAAVRKSDGDLKDAIDRAWDDLDRSGKLAQVFARWHVPFERRTVAETTKEPVR